MSIRETDTRPRCIRARPTTSQATATAMPQMPAVDWNALPLDLIPRIADLLLSDDSIDLLCFRAVCRVWRSLSPDPRSLAFRFRFRPRRWIMLSDGDADLTVPRSFLNISTGRSLRISLLDLYGHSILASTDGLLVLIQEETFLIRIFNPFTHLMVDLPRLRLKQKRNRFAAAMAFSDGTDNNPKVVLSCEQRRMVLWAKPGDHKWEFKIDYAGFRYNPLFFESKFYATDRSGRVWSMSLYCDLLSELVCPDWQPDWDNQVFRSYLVECDSTVLLVRKYTVSRPSGALIELYKIDLDNNGLVLVEGIGDHALFLGPTRTLSVSSKDFPSIRGNSIYLGTDLLNDPVVIYDLKTHQCEPISGQTVIHNKVRRLRPSVRPFTLPDHLITYCSHLQWSNGLMYHEFSAFPKAWSARSDFEFRWAISQDTGSSAMF
ncbi:hypothetical protein LUZ63_007462 [Rhynchospora breviuscula]|uniref:KIB1-4 beta-propeller domain-containing protein n=1 Tax=Rhynchospora breviuscula TaxID=2022672 RepID=A0A9Q0CRT7_9POAL|nr:hypothetical protein LUZ63_007462 [Rhynchospora breviuscula]